MNGMETTRHDNRSTPVIDLHDTYNDNQVLHKFIVKSGNTQQNYCVKLYPFSGYHDNTLKSGLY